MVRCYMVVAAFAISGMMPSVSAIDISAQEASACPSARWLEPAATPQSGDAAGREVTPAEPAWMTTELTDACSGETFALADFAGKAVYVEAMATWCPPCRDQLGRVKEAAAQIPDEERAKFAFVALSSETDLPREALAEYAASNDFPFVFAVMPAPMLQSMAEDLGQEIAVPPATPHLILAPDGTAGAVRTGAESPDDLLALLKAAAAS
jgi:thiol-disulfide isomerase/thioredoxin